MQLHDQHSERAWAARTGDTGPWHFRIRVYEHAGAPTACSPTRAGRASRSGTGHAADIHRRVMRWMHATLAAVALWAAPAEAFRPLVTEDTGTAERFELGAGLDYEGTHRDMLWSPRATLAWGALPRLEVRVEGGLAVFDPSGSEARAGAADTTLGAKVRWLDEAPRYPALMTAVAVRLPTGNADRGLGERDVDVTALAVLSYTVPLVDPVGVGFTLNAGRTFVMRDRRLDAWIVNLAADVRVTDRVSAVAEVVSELGAPGGDVALVRAGALGRVAERLVLDAAIGVGVTRASPDFVATVGFTFAF